MPGKKVKKDIKEESDESESKPLVRGSKKIAKGKSRPEQKSKPAKTSPQKAQKQKQQTKQTKNKSQPTEGKKDDKKNYLPGQRHPTPPDTDGAKAFYLSLLEQCPNNQMAEKWCLDYGCLDYADAVQRAKKYEKLKK